MNEELDSQLSAMFDNELPAAECELLARRLSRDEDLKARWSRYAAIGATISLLGRAGARRIRVLESPWKSADPLEEFMIDAGWEPRDLLSAASNVEFEKGVPARQGYLFFRALQQSSRTAWFSFATSSTPRRRNCLSAIGSRWIASVREP